MTRVMKGGSAVMLDVHTGDLHDRLRYLQCEGVGHHSTLQFIGRDLPADHAAAIVDAAVRVPRMTLRSMGRCATYQTSKGIYLVLEIEKEDGLRYTRDALRTRLDLNGVNIRDVFKWSPHITLAEAPPGTVFAVPEPVAPFDIPVASVTVKLGDQKLRFAL